MFGRGLRLWIAARTSLLFYRGRHDAVIGQCERLLLRHPDEPALYHALGRAHFAQRSYLRAYWSLRHAANRAPAGRPLPAALDYWLGLSAHQLGLHEPCREALERFCRRQGRFERHFTPSVSRVRAISTLGYAYLKLGEPALAIERFESILGSGGAEDTGLLVDLAGLYCSEGIARPRDAIRVLEAALPRFPQEAELLKSLSYAYSLTDEKDRALYYVRKCLQLNSEDRWAQELQSFLQDRFLGRPGGAAHLRLVERLD